MRSFGNWHMHHYAGYYTGWMSYRDMRMICCCQNTGWQVTLNLVIIQHTWIKVSISLDRYMLKLVHNLYCSFQGSGHDSHNKPCSDVILNADRTQVVMLTHRYISSIWDDSDCNSK